MCLRVEQWIPRVWGTWGNAENPRKAAPRLPVAVYARNTGKRLNACGDRSHAWERITVRHDPPRNICFRRKHADAGALRVRALSLIPPPGLTGAGSRRRSIRTHETVARGRGLVAELSLDYACSPVFPRVPVFPPCSHRVPSCLFPCVPSCSLVFPSCSLRVPTACLPPCSPCSHPPTKGVGNTGHGRFGRDAPKARLIRRLLIGERYIHRGTGG